MCANKRWELDLGLADIDHLRRAAQIDQMVLSVGMGL